MSDEQRNKSDEAIMDAYKDEMLSIDLEVAKLKRELGLAKAKAIRDREFSDPDWFHKTTEKLGRKSARRQWLQLEHGKLTKRIRQRSGMTVEAQFVYAAKALLDKEVVDEIWEFVRMNPDCGREIAS